MRPLVMITLALAALGCDPACAEWVGAAARDDVPSLDRQLGGRVVDLTCRHEGETALHAAARGGHPVTVEWLLGRGVDVEVRNAGGRTALHEAATFGHLDVVAFLLDRGARVDAQTSGGRTALSFAAQAQATDVVRVLLDHGADVNGASDTGWTALRVAVATDSDDTALPRLLIERGAWLEAHDDRGWTPLHAAAVRGHAATVTALIDSGANPSAVRRDGRSAIESAEEAGHHHVVTLLEARGAWRARPAATLAPPETSLRWSGRVIGRSGPRAPERGTRCDVTLRPVEAARFNCQLEIRCGEQQVYGGDTGFLDCERLPGGFRALDPMGVGRDGDPAAMIDTVTLRAFVDSGTAAPRGSAFQLSLEPVAS